MKVSIIGLVLAIMFLGSGFAQTEPLSLENCLAISLKNNPTLLRTINNDASAEEDEIGSYRGILPNVSLSASSGRRESGARELEQDVPVGSDPADPTKVIYKRQVIIQEPYVVDFNNFGISVNQNIFDGGEWWQAISHAKSMKRASGFNLQAVINGTVLNTQEAFFTLLKNIKLFEVNQLAVSRSEDNLNKTQKMFELGAVAKVDVFRSQVNLGNDKIQMLLQQNAVLTAKQNLNLVMGRDPQTPLSIKPEFDLPEAFPDINQLYSEALNSNPEIRGGEEALVSSDLAVSRSYAALWPTLSAFFNYNRSNESFDRVYRYSGWDKNWNTTLGLSLQLNLFNGLSDKVRIQKNILAKRNQQETFEESKRMLKSQITQLVDNFNSFLKIIKINEENLEAAQEEFRLAEERYRIGSGTALEVREAQVNLTRAEQTLVAAKYSARMSQAQLEQALGIIYKDSGETS